VRHQFPQIVSGSHSVVLIYLLVDFLAALAALAVQYFFFLAALAANILFKRLSWRLVQWAGSV
jgi:hypothetical protein